MSGTGAHGWGFTDDRGAELRAPAGPARVLAYIRAGAALLDLGVTPVAVYGSGHDGAEPDPAKDGGLTAAGVPYLGPGPDLAKERLRELQPELVVDVTYDGKSPYAVDEGVAERLGVPLAALSVGNDLALPAIIGRFGELGAALGAPVPVPGAGELVAAEAEVRVAATAAGAGCGVLALSGAGAEQVHLARPAAWPELARLAGLGVRLLDPGPGPGANWLTTGWDRALDLAPALVLYDSRAHAGRPEGPERLPAGARLVPWNPEIPPSPTAYARFFRTLAEALRP
ncbi:ABC transporter substrate-binding protein [Streptomyces sp. CC208A]|uniref:ABC transporter substrate-binding protein n=1 Tax=Streptomyces sp. CC208A TaxID=3044573 RepID=UPI0024A93BDB|nr:ABC transporter substrate-binding protein [Streptomyces sp. CC208A]